jgi:Tfp pilus assembly protein PilV
MEGFLMPTIAFRAQRGQGLIEILIVACVIVICSISLMEFQATLTYRDSLALQRSDALVLAEHQIEFLKDFDVLTTQSPYTAYADIASAAGTSVGVNTTFTITSTVTTVVTPSYKTIEVVVSWTDLRNTAQSVHLSTRVAGLQPVFSATVMY